MRSEDESPANPHGRWENKLGARALWHTHLLYLKLPERKPQDSPHRQTGSIQLFSCFTGRGGGSGYTFLLCSLQNIRQREFIPNPEGRPHPSRSIPVFPGPEKKPPFNMADQSTWLSPACQSDPLLILRHKVAPQHLYRSQPSVNSRKFSWTKRFLTKVGLGDI